MKSKSHSLQLVQTFFVKNLVYIVATVLSVFLVVSMARGATTIGLNITTDGNTTLGDATGDTVTFNARVNSTINPSTVNASDLGSLGLGWRTLYASNSVHVSSGAASTTLGSGNLTLTGHVFSATNNASDLSEAARSFKDLYASGTLYLGTTLIPRANNVVDLGSTASALRDIYVSGTLRLGTGGAVSTTLSSNGNLTLTGGIFSATNNASDLGEAARSFKDLYASGTLYLGTTLIPRANNVVDLGSTSSALRDVFVSGTLRLGTGGGASTTLSSNGNLTLTGGIFSATNNGSDLGEAARSFKDLYASGTLYLGTSLLPRSHNLVDLGGTATLALRNIYASGTAWLASVSSTHHSPTTNNTFDLGFADNSWRDLYSSGTLYLGTSLLPRSHNLVDLGGTATLALRNIYASGTAWLASVSSTHHSPTTNNTFDLGFAVNSWRDVYTSGSLYLGTSLLPRANNVVDVGAFGTALRDLYSSGTARLGSVSSTHQSPWTNNTFDLGFADNSWRDLYSSGTLYLGTSLLPRSHNLVDLGGTATLGLRNMYASGTAWLASVSSTHHSPTTNNTFDLGFAVNSWRDVYTSGSLYLGTSLLPRANNVVDVGSTASALRDLYASGTLRLGARAATTTLELMTQGTGTTGLGTCIALSRTDGVRVFIMVTSSISGHAITATTVDCR